MNKKDSNTDITAYRLVKKKWINLAFDGEGAKRFGGRWNSRGIPCVYLAASESLAMLEVMVHLDDYRALQHYCLFKLSLATGDVLTLADEQLPSEWQENPAPAETADIGDGWIASMSSLALSVPSVVVPRERNYLLNCFHPKYAELTRRALCIDFAPDQRL